MPDDASAQAEPKVARWPAMIAILVVGGLYLFISSRYAVKSRLEMHQGLAATLHHTFAAKLHHRATRWLRRRLS